MLAKRAVAAAQHIPVRNARRLLSEFLEGELNLCRTHPRTPWRRLWVDIPPAIRLLLVKLDARTEGRLAALLYFCEL